MFYGSGFAKFIRPNSVLQKLRELHLQQEKESYIQKVFFC